MLTLGGKIKLGFALAQPSGDAVSPHKVPSRQSHWAATVVGPQEGVKSPFVLSQSVGLLAGSKPAFLTSALDYITFD